MAAVALEPYDAFLGLGYVNVSRRVALSFSFVDAPYKIGFSGTQLHILFGLSEKPCAVCAEGKPQSKHEEP